MISEERLPGAEYLVVVLDGVIVRHLLPLPDVLRGHDHRGGADVGPGRVGSAGMVEERQGGVDTGPYTGHCDPLLLVPGHGLADVLPVVEDNLQQVVEQPAYQDLAVIQLSVRLPGGVGPEVIVDLQVVKHQTG